MSAPAQTKIFGIRIGGNPKVIAGVFLAFALGLLWFNTRSDDDSGPPASSAHQTPALAPVATLRPVRVVKSRRSQSNVNDRGTLRLRPIDPTKGDVDPTLRLDLLARLQAVEPASEARNLFEVGPAPLSPAEQKLLSRPPVVPKPIKPLQPIGGSTVAAAEPPFNIPLKYYGFVKNGPNSQSNQGLFLEGDNVLVGSEGEMVGKKYLIVSLTPNNARLEDPQVRKGQTLTLVPAANP